SGKYPADFVGGEEGRWAPRLLGELRLASRVPHQVSQRVDGVLERLVQDAVGVLDRASRERLPETRDTLGERLIEIADDLGRHLVQTQVSERGQGVPAQLAAVAFPCAPSEVHLAPQPAPDGLVPRARPIK